MAFWDKFLEEDDKKEGSELQATTETHIPKEAISEPKKDFISENIEIEEKVQIPSLNDMNKSAKLNFIKFSYALLTQKSTTNLKLGYMRKVVSERIKNL